MKDEDFESLPPEIRDALKHGFLGIEADQDEARVKFFANLLRAEFPENMTLAESHFMSEFERAAEMFLPAAANTVTPGMIDPFYSDFLDKIAAKTTKNLCAILAEFGPFRDESVKRFEGDLLIRKLEYVTRAKRLKFEADVGAARAWTASALAFAQQFGNDLNQKTNPECPTRTTAQHADLEGYESTPGPKFDTKVKRTKSQPHSNPEEELAGKLKVTFEKAAVVLGVTKRRVRELVSEGSLVRVGEGQSKGICTESLRRRLGIVRNSEANGTKRN